MLVTGGDVPGCNGVKHCSSIAQSRLRWDSSSADGRLVTSTMRLMLRGLSAVHASKDLDCRAPHVRIKTSSSRKQRGRLAWTARHACTVRLDHYERYKRRFRANLVRPSGRPSLTAKSPRQRARNIIVLSRSASTAAGRRCTNTSRKCVMHTKSIPTRRLCASALSQWNGSGVPPFPEGGDVEKAGLTISGRVHVEARVSEVF